jgi:hypothetical protein
MRTLPAFALVVGIFAAGAFCGGAAARLHLGAFEARIEGRIRELYRLEHRRNNAEKGPRWTEEEWQVLRPRARLFGVPLSYAKALRMFENGGWLFPYGQTSEDWSVKALFPEADWQMVQAQRTVNRGLIHYLWSRCPEMAEGRDRLGRRPDPERIIRWLELERDGALSTYLALEAWNMRAGRGDFLVFMKQKVPELEGAERSGK